MKYQRIFIRLFGRGLFCFFVVVFGYFETYAIDLDAAAPLESKQEARKLLEKKIVKGGALPKLFKSSDLNKWCEVVRLDGFAGRLSFSPGINSVLFAISVLPGTEGPNCVLFVEIADLISVEEFKRAVSTDITEISTSIILNFDIVPKNNSDNQSR